MAGCQKVRKSNWKGVRRKGGGRERETGWDINKEAVKKPRLPQFQMCAGPRELF